MGINGPSVDVGRDLAVFIDPQAANSLGTPAATFPSAADALRARALEDSSWRSVAAPDAAVRATTSLTNAGGLAKGREAERGLEAFVARATSEVEEAKPSISPSYWFARPDSDDSSQLLLRGAVLVRARGVRDDRTHRQSYRSARRPA